jgi:putative glutamine amidotransferase
LNLKTKRIAITQRTFSSKFGVEKYDALDQQWFSFLSYCGLTILLVPNLVEDLSGYLQEINVEGVILTGGGGITGGWQGLNNSLVWPRGMGHQEMQPERDRVELSLLEHSIEYNLPVLGVCRGMLFINLFQGGDVSEMRGHVGESHTLTSCSEEYIFDGHVNSYHEFGIYEKDLGSNLYPLAKSKNTIEALRHNKYQHFGIMWHPERNLNFSEHDKYFIRSIFKSE